MILYADIPRNPTGKIEKPKLREMYGANKLLADQNIKKKIKEFLKDE